ncbi:adenylate/guanylate cyclase domain-containing protein [Chelatococcus reniformis]|uniref:Adenylate/guanylate cyclase domain-containing protein n=2 Tax=Chelatococcus reniformis TaxID=1494448 RepID=A0A916UWT4_9HYPH|nr:adenylate/guanylate cyclase domain-containing protein [Chelatococcus reniformis]
MVRERHGGRGDGAGGLLLHGSVTQRLRLLSGLVLFAFALTHFLNTALGIVSLEVMIAAQNWRVAVTRSLPGSIVLGLALVVHAGLALVKVAGRGNLALKPWEWLQVGLGLAIPFLLLPHIVGTRFAATAFGVDDDYVYELTRLWPASAVNQSLLLLIVWIHGCLGMHFWLRLAPGYGRIAPFLLVGAVLVPVLALTGFLVQGRDVAEAMSDPATLAALKERTQWPTAAAEDRLEGWRQQARFGFYALVAAALAVLAARMAWSRTRRRIPVQYFAGPRVLTVPGRTLLEISRANAVPHLAVCGGRARCSTCRVRVLDGLAGLSPPAEAERRTLRAIGADPDVRLACQARPWRAATVLRLLPDQRLADMREAARSEATGVERTFAVLFVDIRGFTRLSEEKLPYDVVFILNRVFQTLGGAIEQSGGRIEKYIGDGLLALFEDTRGVGGASAAALRAAAAVDRALDRLNADLEPELGAPLAVAMGLHAGPLIVGKIGWGAAASITVIGPTVNVASRLEAIAKSENVQLAVSQPTVEAAGIATADLDVRRFEVKGVAAAMDIVLVGAARHVERGPAASPGAAQR